MVPIGFFVASREVSVRQKSDRVQPALVTLKLVNGDVAFSDIPVLLIHPHFELQMIWNP